MQLLPSWSERLGKHLLCQAQYNKAIPRHWPGVKVWESTCSVRPNTTKQFLATGLEWKDGKAPALSGPIQQSNSSSLDQWWNIQCTFKSPTSQIWWKGWHSQYSDSLWAGQSRVPTLVWEKFFVLIQTGTKSHPASCTMGTVSPTWA
jgi:hypothetical protein